MEINIEMNFLYMSEEGGAGGVSLEEERRRVIHKSAASLLEALHGCVIVFFPSSFKENWRLWRCHRQKPPIKYHKTKKNGVLLGRGLQGRLVGGEWGGGVKGHRVGKPLNSYIRADISRWLSRGLRNVRKTKRCVVMLLCVATHKVDSIHVFLLWIGC